jgi:2-polyprenyl-6-methoxyphenol hydroxylase-like FAD-dependent oxidoreductase
MAGSRRVAIVGGSLGGLFAAIYLARSGWQVDVYERNPTELAGRGAGIATHPELRAVLKEAGVADVDEGLGVFVPERRVYRSDGSVEASMPFPQTNTSWERLYNWLVALVPPERRHLGRAVARVEQSDAAATLVFGDGTSTTVDLVVAADGVRSTIRQQLLPDVIPDYVGYIAWRGLVEEKALSPAAHAALFSCFGFCLPTREQMLGYPVAGRDNDIRPGHRRYNFVWYRPADAATLADMLTDDTGKTHALGIPPPLIRKDVVAHAMSEAARVLSPAFAEAVARTELPFFQPIADLAVPRMGLGRVAILGDAAFVARPHVGAGVTKAGEDALSLARALEAEPDVPAALARFDAERRPVGDKVIAQARFLGAYMQAQVLPGPDREKMEHFRTPQAVMDGTANLAFLR